MKEVKCPIDDGHEPRGYCSLQQESIVARMRYSKDFKLSAAKLVVEQGYSFSEVAQQLGCSGWSVRDWVRKYRASGELSPREESTSAASDYAKLRDENARLRMENEILKKAAAYFAKESL